MCQPLVTKGTKPTNRHAPIRCLQAQGRQNTPIEVSVRKGI